MQLSPGGARRVSSANALRQIPGALHLGRARTCQEPMRPTASVRDWTVGGERPSTNARTTAYSSARAPYYLCVLHGRCL